MVFVALRRVTRHRDALVRQILASQQIPILICIGEALAALSSSIPGSAFIAPIVPAAMTLAVAALYEIQPNLAAYRRTLAATACAIALTAALPLIDLTWPIARPWTAAVPVLGQSTITDGRGGNQKYEASGGFSSKNPAQPVEPDQSRLWLDLSTRTATALRRQGGNIPVTAFGFRHFLYNVNTVSLQHAAMGGQLLPLRQVAPTVTGSSTRGYLDWLDGESADACLLLTMNGNRAQFIPLVISDNMREAAVQAKFVPIEHWSTPDNQEVTLWKRSVSRCDSSS
jgi:multisubunit Na+/H+ antiporter MnhB subunit